MRPSRLFFNIPIAFAAVIIGSSRTIAWQPKSYGSGPPHITRVGRTPTVPGISFDSGVRSPTQLLAQPKTRSKEKSGQDLDQDTKSSLSFPWADRSKAVSQMPNQVDNLTSASKDSAEEDVGDSMSPELVGAGVFAGVVATVVVSTTANQFDISANDFVLNLQNTLQNPSAALDQVVESVESMGPQGALYFGIAYTIAEVLAIPAIPLTASAGYLFGPVEGTAVVLLSASIAAAISFVIGRTLLRDYVESVLEEYPKFAKLDRAIGKEGFKLMLLLRLSPIFPFALSNYLYGASSINFSAFFWGTLLGFAPGTIAYVCTGAFGKALTGGDETYPWYVYAGGLTLLAGLIKVLADTATRVVEEMEEDEGR